MTATIGYIIALSATIGLAFYIFRPFYWRKIGLETQTTIEDILGLIYWVTLLVGGILLMNSNANYAIILLVGNLIIFIYLIKYFARAMAEYWETLTDFVEELNWEKDNEFNSKLFAQISLDEIRNRMVISAVLSLLLFSFSLSLITDYLAYN